MFRNIYKKNSPDIKCHRAINDDMSSDHVKSYVVYVQRIIQLGLEKFDVGFGTPLSNYEKKIIASLLPIKIGDM